MGIEQHTRIKHPRKGFDSESKLPLGKGVNVSLKKGRIARNGSFRIESDPLGEKLVPANVYYGVQTQRALENFAISGIKANPVFVNATVMIKKAAAEANMETGRLSLKKGRAIVQAADEVLSGKLRDQFVVDVYQAGAGTSHNMNVNEVLANRAIEILGGNKGDYSLVNPNDDVNMGQSTNEVIPAALRLATLNLLSKLVPALDNLAVAFEAKAAEFSDVVKSGRTHLQDALPITLGQELSAYATTIRKHIKRIENGREALKELNVGATAMGTGLNAEPVYAQLVIEKLSKWSQTNFRSPADLIQITQFTDDFIEISSALKGIAIDLIKIANDLRLMNSGPRTGFAEIRLPAVQPGSSIIPGKVNPVMAEALNMVCFQVIGYDLAITLAGQAGQLELNVMMPVIAYDLLQSVEILTNAISLFAEKALLGIIADRDRCRTLADESIGLATALNPYLGYRLAAEVAKQALTSGKTIRQTMVEEGLMSPEMADKVLALLPMTKPGIKGKD